MNDKAKLLEFRSRKDFRTWLNKHGGKSDGIWIRFTKGGKLFTSNDALEEALCFGWIDGLMKSIDAQSYQKYFSRRKDRLNWSEKNRSLFKKLRRNGLMTEQGVLAFQCGSRPLPKTGKTIDHSEKIAVLKMALKDDKPILKSLEGLSVSRQKQLAGFYGEAKTDETREKRKRKIMEAIRTNSKGMLY